MTDDKRVDVGRMLSDGLRLLRKVIAAGNATEALDGPFLDAVADNLDSDRTRIATLEGLLQEARLHVAQPSDLARRIEEAVDQ